MGSMPNDTNDRSTQPLGNGNEYAAAGSGVMNAANGQSAQPVNQPTAPSTTPVAADADAPMFAPFEFAPTEDDGSDAPSAASVAGSTQRVRKRRKHRRHSKRKRRRRIIILIVVLVLALIIGIPFAAWNIVHAHMDSQIQQTNNEAQVDVAETQDDGQTITYQGHKYRLNQNMLSILFMGHDDTAETKVNALDDQADAICVMAIDTSTGSLKVINVPRDSMVAVDEYGVDSEGNQTNYTGQSVKQLCLAYAYGHGGEAISNVEAAVGRILHNVPITYYVDLDESGIGPLADSIGGVPVTALATIPGTDIVEGDSVILTGNNAHKYVQYRNVNDLTSSLDRQERQSQFIKAFMSKAISNAKNNLGMVSDLYATAQQYITTNLDLEAVVYLAQCVINHGVSSPEMTTLQGTSQVDESTTYHEYYLDESNVTQTVIDVYYTRVD